MITRIVRLSFEPSKVDEFLEIFKASKDKIAAREGCQSVVLMQDEDHDNVYYTYSIWDGKEYLESYRHSDLFAGVWAKTKVLFNDKPLAYSLKKT